MPEVINIPTTVKCKRKLKPDGSYDKHKARMAARGDILVRKMLKLGMDLPDTFSPTIRTLTFLLVLQIADLSVQRKTSNMPTSTLTFLQRMYQLSPSFIHLSLRFAAWILISCIAL